MVAKQLWGTLLDILGVQLGGTLDNIGKFWLSSKRNGVLDMCTSAAFWSLWKLRNDLCFQRKTWRSMAMLLCSMAMMLQNWVILCPGEKKEALMDVVVKVKKEASRVCWIGWK
jgi:hypothetical protein